MSINTVPSTNKKGNLRWIIAAVCFLAYMVAFFDRSNVSILIADKNFTDAFGITADKSTQGLLLTVFLLFYGLSCFFAGPMVQRYGSRKMLGLGLASWAILMAIMGSVSAAIILLLCRAILGIGEALLGPSVSKLIQTWFPVHERAKANGVWFIGIQIAQMISMPMITWLIIAYNWRTSFYFLAILGVIPVILCLAYVYDSPSRNPKITNEEVEYITGSTLDTKPSEKVAGSFNFVKESNFWLAVVIYSIVNAGYWGFMGWVPTYLKTTLGFSFAKMGLIAALPYIGGTIAVVLLTPVMDRSNKRASFTVAGCLGFGVLLFTSMFITDRTTAVVLLCLSNVFIMPVMPALFTILQNTIKPNEVANATGFFNGVSYTFASLFPYGLGALYNVTGNLKSGFYVLVAIMIIAVFAGIPLVKRRL